MDAKTASVFFFSLIGLVAICLRNFDCRNNVALHFVPLTLRLAWDESRHFDQPTIFALKTRQKTAIFRENRPLGAVFLLLKNFFSFFECQNVYDFYHFLHYGKTAIPKKSTEIEKSKKKK